MTNHSTINNQSSDHNQYLLYLCRPQALDFTWTFQATATAVPAAAAASEEENNRTAANSDGNFAELQPLRIDAASATTLDDLDKLTDLIQVNEVKIHAVLFIWDKVEILIQLLTYE